LPYREGRGGLGSRALVRVRSEAMADGGKPGVSLAVVGTESCGKTTLLAQLCHLLGGFEEERHKECRDLAKELGRPSCEHAWMLDTLAMERERGFTVTSSFQHFTSGSFRYIAIDTPGHAEYAKNMLSVTSLADVAVLVVSAADGEYEAGIASGQIRELSLSCFTMGIKNIVVLVTKMDDPSVQYSSSRFDDIKKVVEKFLKEVGYKQKDVPFIPVSGLHGLNLTTKSSEMGWYGGTPVIDTLDGQGPINRPAEKPLRFPVLKVHEISSVGTVIEGRVETGSVKVGGKVIFSPSGHVAEVESIQVGSERISEAKGGEVVGICISGEFRPGDIRRGMVASSSSNDPAAAAEAFVAQVIVLEHPGTIRAGYCPQIAIHTAQLPCEFEELLSKIDRKTGKEVEANPAGVKTGDVVSARLRPLKQVCVEAFSAYPSLGRFAVRDHGRTIAVGVVKEVTKLPIPKPKYDNENQYFDD